MEYGKTFNNFGDFWSDADLAILRREYPKGGIRRVSELLPHRSHQSIRTKASRMNLKRPECDRGKGFDQNVFNKMSPVEAAYFAGFFDGEGCIHITKTHRLSVTVSNTNVDIIQRFASVIGGTVKVRSRYNPKQRDITRWCVSGQRAMMFLEKLLPYLLVKKEEAKLAIDYQKAFVYTSRKITPDVFEARQAIRNKLSNMKGRIK